jgi:hypothetical protein
MLPQPVGVQTRATSPVSAARSKTRGRLSACDPILKRLAQDLQDMAAALGELIQKEHAMMGQRHLTRHRHVAAADQSPSEMVWWGARHGRVVTHAVRSPVRPATRWIRVVSMAQRLIAGRMVVSRWAGIDVPARGELRQK